MNPNKITSYYVRHEDHRPLEIRVSFVRSQQIYRLSITPYVPNTALLDVYQGHVLRLAKGRFNQKKLADLWNTINHPLLLSHLSELFQNNPEALTEYVKALYLI